MKRSLGIISLCFFLFACNDVDSWIGRREGPKQVSYSYSCLDSALGGKKGNRRLENAGDLIRDIAVSEKSVTDEKQTEYGALFHKEMLEAGTFRILPDSRLQANLDKVLKDLLAARQQPSAIQYFVHPLQDTVVNAYTFGGRIYITTAMLEKCQGKEGLLYAIMGHEIGHSESGHIRSMIQDMELTSRVFGDENAGLVLQLKQFLTASFNQRNELEADYYGINLTNALSYDVCTAVSFWKEMSRSENQYSELEDFFRTHPFSGLRAECLLNHIRNNFGKNCEK